MNFQRWSKCILVLVLVLPLWAEGNQGSAEDKQDTITKDKEDDLPSILELSKTIIIKPTVEILDFIREKPNDHSFDYLAFKNQNHIVEEHFKRCHIWFSRFLLVLQSKVDEKNRDLIIKDLADGCVKKNGIMFVYALNFELRGSEEQNLQLVRDIFLRFKADNKDCVKKCSNKEYNAIAARIEPIEDLEIQSNARRTHKLILKVAKDRMQELEPKLE